VLSPASQGSPTRARALFERAIAIGEKAAEPHPDLAAYLNNLALLLEDKGTFAGAKALYERAITVGCEALGPEHPDLATYLNNLALLLWQIPDIARAIPLQSRAIQILELRGDVALAAEYRRELDSLTAEREYPYLQIVFVDEYVATL